MKAHVRQLLFKIGFVAISLLLLFNLNLDTNKKSTTQNQVIDKVFSVGLPTHLIIPSINVNAPIRHVGLTSKREMEVPNNAVDVGWYDLGPRPGEKGSAVINGHFNTENGDAGVFFNLYKLKIGDKIFIKNDRGTDIVFAVQRSQLFDSGLAGEVFSLNDGTAHLNIITCDGVWDGIKKTYTKRLVVFADLEK